MRLSLIKYWISYNRDSSLGSCIFKPTKRCFLDRYINPIFNIFTQHFILWLRNKLSCIQFPNIDTRLSLENVKTYSSAFFLRIRNVIIRVSRTRREKKKRKLLRFVWLLNKRGLITLTLICLKTDYNKKNEHAFR